MTNPLLRLNRLRQLIQKDVDALPELKSDSNATPNSIRKPESDPLSPNSSGSIALDLSTRMEATTIKDTGSNEISGNNYPNPKVDDGNHLRESLAFPVDDDNDNLSIKENKIASTQECTRSNGQDDDLRINDFDEWTRGQLAPLDMSFCPVLLLGKFPYKFVNRDSHDVATKFFDDGKFWDRKWSLFYIWPLDESKPLILVPKRQFHDLLEEIQSHFCHLHLLCKDVHYREVHLLMDFPHHPRLRPRYLGTAFSRSDYDYHINRIPSTSFRFVNEPSCPTPSSEAYQKFRESIDAAADLLKSRKSGSKGKKQQDQIIRHQNMGGQLKRAQRYLGLRPRNPEIPTYPISNPSISWQETIAIQKQRLEALTVPSIDPDSPVPFPFDQDVVFLAIDVESYERNHSIITEIGIATLDTLDLIGIPPGENGVNWHRLIHARHLRIREHSSYVNSEFVQGCPDQFSFGKSEFIALNDATITVESLFNNFTEFCSSRDGEKTNSQLSHKRFRRIVLVCHDAGADLNYLHTLGYNPLNHPALIETLDTVLIYQAFRGNSQGISLGNLLHQLDMIGWHLHNAGNDAVYTLHALFAIAVREGVRRGISKTHSDDQSW